MIDLIQKINPYPKKLDFFIFLGLILWIASIVTLESGLEGWKSYLLLSGMQVASQLPVLVFVWKRHDLVQNLTTGRYRRLWILYFAVFLPLLIIGGSLMLDGQSTVWEVIVSAAVASLALELILRANAFYASRIRRFRWIRHLNLEKAVLISIAFIALTLAAMAVTSMHDPRYHSKGQLLIGFEFDLWKILGRFDTFLSYVAQLLFMYLCGYFFFLINSRLLVARILKERGILLYMLSSLALVGIFYPIIGQILTMLPVSGVAASLVGYFLPILLSGKMPLARSLFC